MEFIFLSHKILLYKNFIKHVDSLIYVLSHCFNILNYLIKRYCIIHADDMPDTNFQELILEKWGHFFPIIITKHVINHKENKRCTYIIKPQVPIIVDISNTCNNLYMI